MLHAVFLITGTYYPAIYYAFFCQPVYQVIYMLGVSGFGASELLCVTS
jgi:adiponectin receptor